MTTVSHEQDNKWLLIHKNAGDRKRQTKRKLGKVLTYVFVLMLVVAVLAPFLWMVISSISPQVELSAKPPHWIPENPTLTRYRALILGSESGSAVPAATQKFLRGMLSSLVVSVSTTAVCVVAGTMAAYALARLPVPGKQNFMLGILSAQMVPIIVIIIPLYLLMQKFALMDTWRGLVLTYSGFMLPTVIWIMHSYFLTIPHSLEEAAMIDGCSRLSALIKVIFAFVRSGTRGCVSVYVPIFVE